MSFWLKDIAVRDEVSDTAILWPKNHLLNECKLSM